MDRIARAASRSGRRATEVVLVAVSKYAEPDQIRELIQMGHRDFGESQVQQLLQRAAMIDEWLLRQRSMLGASRAAGLGRGRPTSPPSPPRSASARSPNATARSADPAGPDGVRWHMVGHLQRNKVTAAIETFDIIHAIDSVRLAEVLSRKAPKRLRVFLQVNVALEASKYGFTAGELPAAVSAVRALPNLEPIGLMTIAPASPDPEAARPFFRRLRQLANEFGLAELSMGMSDDFEVAVEEGATMVRIGRALFGERA